MSGSFVRAIQIVKSATSPIRRKRAISFLSHRLVLSGILAGAVAAQAHVCCAGIISFLHSPSADELKLGPGLPRADQEWEGTIPDQGITLDNQRTLALAVDNSFDAAFYKSVTFTLQGTNLTRDNVKIIGVTGMTKEKDGKVEKPTTMTPKFDSKGTQLQVTAIFPQQPQWEFLEIQALKRQITLSAKSKAAYECYESINSGKKRTGKSKGLVDEPGLRITQFWEFPQNVDIDTSSIPSFSTDAAAGQWSYQFVTQDPNGNPMPHGGVEWTTNGPGLSQQEAFDWTTIMNGTADTLYQDFFFDANAPPDDPNGGYIELQTACAPEPSALLLFGMGAIGFISRRLFSRSARSASA